MNKKGYTYSKEFKIIKKIKSISKCKKNYRQKSKEVKQENNISKEIKVIEIEQSSKVESHYKGKI